MWAGIAQTVQRLATAWTVRRTNIGRGDISALVQTGPGPHTTSYTVGIGSFPGVKRSGRGFDHPPPYSAEVNERVELYVCSPSGVSWPVLGWNLTLLLPSHALITDLDCTCTPSILTLKDSAFRQRIGLHFCVSMTLIVRPFSCYTISQHRTSTKHL